MCQYLAGPVDLLNDGAGGSNSFGLACLMGSGSITNDQQLGWAGLDYFGKHKGCCVWAVKNNKRNRRGQLEFAHAKNFLK
jgi:hypothetical protein